MLELDDARWTELRGSYGVPYDPRPALAKLARGHDVSEAWDEIWDQLHHQGDVGDASYAAVPHLLRIHKTRGVSDWNTFALTGCIEQARRCDHNPSIPAWLRDGYDRSWREIVELALEDLARSEDPNLVRSALGVIAIARGLHRFGEVLLDFTEDELDELIEALNQPPKTGPTRAPRSG